MRKTLEIKSIKPLTQTIFVGYNTTQCVGGKTEMKLKIVSGRLLAVVALTCATSSAFAQSSSKTALPKSNKSVAQKKKSTLDTLREKAVFSYYGSITGPGVNLRDMGATQTAKEERDVVSIFHQVRAGVRLSPVDSAGTILRYSTDMAMYDLNDKNNKLSPTQSGMLNPRLYYRRNNVVENKAVNLQLEMRADIPTEKAWKDRSLITALGFGQNFTIKTAPAWNVGLSLAETYYLYDNKNNKAEGQSKPNPRMRYGIAPSLAYNFNDQIALSSYAWLDSQSYVGRKMTKRNSYNDDYVRVGPSISPNSHLNFFPCVQVFTSNAQLRTTTVGFEMSASL